MKKAFIFYLLLIPGLICISSCKKLVEIPPNPTTAIGQQAVFADSTSTLSAIAGVYSGFAFLDGNLSKFAGISADELTTSPTSVP